MKSGIVKKFKTFISLLLVFLMVVGIMPLNTIANAITWDLRSATVEYGGKNIYLFGVDSAQIKGDEDAQFIIQYSGADNMAEELYIDGAKETSASSNVTVNTNDNTVTIQKQWFETQSGWIGLKLSGKAYVPDSEPNLPEITGVTVEGVSTSYQGNEVDAVNITGADGCIVEYSVNGGSFTTEMPKLTAPTASALEITVKVTKNGYRELLKNVTANMTLGRVPVEVEPVSVLYSGSEIKLLSEPVYDSGLATLSYRVAGESDFKSDIPVRKYPGTYDVEIKVTPSNTTLYEEYTFTKTAVINSLVFDIDQIKIVPNTLTYNGTEQQAIAEPQYDPDMFENIQIKYKLDSEPDSSYSTDIPTVKNAGTYTFNVLITADGYEDYETSVSVNVEKAIPDISYSLNTNAVYSEGADIYLVTNAVVNKGEGKIEYSLNGSGYTTTVPTVKNAGAYRVSIRMPETDNYKGKTFESSRSITVAKATFVMDLPETPKEIVYNIDNTFGYQVKDSSKLPEGVIEYSIDEDGTTADAQIDEATGKVTYNGTGKITVKAVFISSASNNYKVEQGKDTVTYSLEIKYTSIPKEWNITESPFTSYDGFDFYGDTVTINSPDGWKVKRESVDFTGSEDETITATDWETSIAVDKFGSYENYTVRFKNDDTGEISESVTLDNFAIDNESTFSDVSYFNMYEINEDALPEIINILTFGVFCGEEARIAATAPNKQVGNAFEPAKEVIFTFGDNTNIPVQVKNGIAVTKFPENFSGTVKAQVVGFSGAESNITKMTETNSNVRFDSADNNKIITIDINPPVITDITFYEEIENSNGEINDVVVSVDEHNTFKVRNEFKVKVNASDELSGIAYIECTIDCNGKKETKKVSYTELKKFVADTIKGLTPFDDSAKTKISIKAVNNALLESETFVYYVNGDMTAPEIMSVKPTGDESVELLSEENKLKNDFAYFSQEAVELSVDIDDTNDGQIFSSGDVKLSYRFEAYPGESGTTDFSPYSNDYSVEVPENFKGWVIFKVKDGSRNESEEIWTKGIITASSAEHSKDNEGAFEKPNTGIFGTDQGSVFSSEDMLNSIYPDGNSHANEVAQEKTDKRDIYDIFKIESDTMFTVTLNNNYSGIKDVKFYKFDGEFTSFSSNTEISQENIVLLSDGKITKNGIDVQRKYELKKDALNVNNIDQTLVIVVTDNADYKYCMYYTFGTDGADPSIPTIKVDGEPSNDDILNKKTLPKLEIVPAESDSSGSNESVCWKINDSDFEWLDDKAPEITEDGYYVITAWTVDESGRESAKVETKIYVDQVMPVIESIAPVEKEETNLLVQGNYDENNKNNFEYFAETSGGFKVVIDDTDDGKIYSSENIKLTYKLIGTDNKDVVEKTVDTQKEGNKNYYVIEVPKDFKGWIVVSASDRASNISNGGNLMSSKGIIVADYDEHVDDIVGTLEKPQTDIYNTTKSSDFNAENMLASVYPDGHVNSYEVAQENGNNRDIYDILKMETETMFTVTLKNEDSGIKDVKFYTFSGSFTELNDDTEIDGANIQLIDSITANGIDTYKKYTVNTAAFETNYYDQTLIVTVTDNVGYKYCMYYTFGTEGSDPDVPTIKVDGESSNGNTLNKKTLPKLEIVPADSDLSGSNESVRWKINDSEYVWLNDDVPEITEDGYYVVTAQAVDESGRVSAEVSTIIYVDQVMPVIESIAPVEKEETNLLVDGDYDENNKNSFEYFAETSEGFKVVIDDTDDGKIYSSENIKLTYKLIGTDNEIISAETVDTQKDGNKNYYVIEVPNSFKGWIVVSASDRTSNISNGGNLMSSKGIIVADYAEHANDIVGTLEKPKTNIYNTTKSSDFDSDGMLGSVYPDGRVNSYKVAQENGNNRDIYDILEMKTETMFTVTLKNEYSGIKDVKFYRFSGNFTELNEDTEIDSANIQLIDSATANGIDTYRKYTIKTDTFDENYHDQTLIVTVTDNVGYKYCMYYTFGTEGNDPDVPTIKVDGEPSNGNTLNKKTLPNLEIVPAESDSNGSNESVRWKINDSDYVWLNDKVPEITEDGYYVVTAQTVDESGRVSDEVSTIIYVDQVMPVIESIAPVEKEETNLLVDGDYDENNKNNFEYFAETSGGFKVVIDDTDDGKIYSSENIKLTYKLIGADNKVVVEDTVDTQKDGNKNYYVIEVPKSFKGWIVVLASDRTSNISNGGNLMSSKGIIVADYDEHANDIVGTLEKPKTNIYNTTKSSDFDSDGMLGSVYPDGRVNSYKVAQENGNNRDIYDILEMKTETMFTVTLKNEYSGIKDVKFYRFSGNFTELNEDTEIDSANIQLIDSTTANGIDTYKKYTVNTTAFDENAFDENYHDQTLIVTVTDNVEYKYCMYYTFGSDGVTPGEPTINVTGTHNGDNEWFTNSPDGQGPQVTINPHEKDDRGTNEFVLWKWDSDTDYTDLADSAPSIVKNGVYQLSTYAYDEAKHESSIVTQEIKYDSVAPEFKVTINNNEIDMADHTGYYFYKDPIEIKIDSWDVPDNNDNDFKGSGVASVLYKIVYKGQEYTNVEWTSYDVNNKPKVYPNNSFTLYVKTIDVAGNATEKSTKTIVVDDKPPVGEDYSKPEISYYIPSTSTGFYTNAVTVDLKVIDHKYIGQTPSANGSCSGIEKLDYTLKVDGVILEDRTNLIDNSQNGEIIDTQTSLINLDLPRCNSNDIEITLYASDKAGNETVYTIESGIIKIDATAPEIYVSYDNNSPVNDHFYNSTRTATVVITERNLDYNDVDITVTNTDGTAPVYSQWVKTMGTGNKDNTTHTMTITYNADGDYTFAIKVADMAGNTDSGTAFANGTANPDSFTVDMTKPVVSVSYDNNSAQNSKYFNAVRNATITVEEHNFDLQFVTTTITAAIEGQGISAPTVSWSHSGDTHTAYIGYTSDGDYTFDFDMADLAANKIDGVNYGASVAAQDFTVDTTIVEPTIEGVENGMPYKDELIPSISFSDTNYSDYTVSLTRTRMNEIDVDVTELFTSGLISETGNGGSGVFDTFEKIRENDGIYRLTVTLNDLAGNTATSEVMFSVNRFGSVYVFGDYLISLQDAYVQKVSDDLVITEYNPDKLVEDSVKVQVTHDSSPMGNVNYTVNPVVNDAVSVGESGWYQYKYVIDSDNFEKDGVYSVIISSADEAGNMPETINFDDLEVLFRVDTVKPELTDIKGLEEAIVNSTGVDVTFSMFDAIGLKQVDIYVSGEKVNTLDASENMINFVGQFTIGEGADQSVRIVAEDMAGNILDTDSEEFNTDLTFVKSITVSTNFFVRWYANKVLFWSTTIAAVLILGGIAFFIYRKRREDEE